MADINILKERYELIFGAEPSGDRVISKIEDQLGITLPSDFKAISKFYSGGLIGQISHHEIACDGAATNIVKETLRLRNAIGLKKNFVVLAEPSESLIVLNLLDQPSVIWCDAIDVANLDSMEFNSQPDTWNSYSDFIECLLDEE